MNIPVFDQPAAGPAGSPGQWAGWQDLPSDQGLLAGAAGRAACAQGAVAAGFGPVWQVRRLPGVPLSGDDSGAILVPGMQSVVTDDSPGELAAGRRRSGRTPRGGADKGAPERSGGRKGRAHKGAGPAAGGGASAGQAPGGQSQSPGGGGQKPPRRGREDDFRRGAQSRRDETRRDDQRRDDGERGGAHKGAGRGGRAAGAPGERSAGEKAGGRGGKARRGGLRGLSPASSGKAAAHQRGGQRSEPAVARPSGRGAAEGQPQGHNTHAASAVPAARDTHGHRDGHRSSAEVGASQPGRRTAVATDAGAAGVRRYAALDLGTNNCRLLIAEPRGRYFRVVDAFSRIVRLGEGVSLSGVLADAAMDRAIEALKVCRRKLIDRRVDRFRLIATEACRAAANGDAFLARVREEADLELEVVSRETEARLAVAGCASLVDRESDGAILFDIGGGSSELVWLDLRRRGGPVAASRAMRAWTSLPVGVVALADRYGGITVTPDVFENMVGEVSHLLGAFNPGAELDAGVAAGRVHFLGTSGTVTTLAGVHLGLERYDRRRVDGTWLETADLTRMIGAVCAMPFEARVENPCIGRDRADLVIAGCAILEAIRRRWPCRRLRVADRGLREGILTELMAADRGHGHGGGRPGRGRREAADGGEGARR